MWKPTILFAGGVEFGSSCLQFVHKIWKRETSTFSLSSASRIFDRILSNAGLCLVEDLCYQNMFLLRSATWGPSHKRNKHMSCIGEIVHSWSRLRLNKKEISLKKIWFANWDTNRRTKSMPLQKTVSVNTHLDFFQHNTSSPHILISHQLKLNGGRMIRPLSDEESRWILLFKLTFLAWSRSSSDCFSKNLWNPAKATSSRSKW